MLKNAEERVLMGPVGRRPSLPGVHVPLSTPKPGENRPFSALFRSASLILGVLSLQKI